MKRIRELFNSTTLNSVIGIIGIISTIIAIILGLVSVHCLNVYNESIDNSQINQNAKVIYNGMNEYAVIQLTRDVTEEELEKKVSEIIEHLEMLNKEGSQEYDNRIKEIEDNMIYYEYDDETNTLSFYDHKSN